MPRVQKPRVRGPRAQRGRPVKRVVCLSNNYGVYPGAFFPETAGARLRAAGDARAAREAPEGFFGLLASRPRNLGWSRLRSDVAERCAPLPRRALTPKGTFSLDQRIGEFVGAATRYPTMTLRVNDANLVSWTRTGVQVPALDLRETYRALFLEDSPEAKAREAQRVERHTSILDVVLDDAKSLRRSLGKRDQRKFGEYLDSVRTLEKKIVQQAPWIDRPKPATDRPEPQPGRGTEADLRDMIELVALAIETDSTRAITLTSGFVSGDFGFRGGYHGISHHGEREYEVNAKKAIERNQIAQLAHLIALLKAREDTVNGGTLFDHTMILYGCGMATGHHSTKDLPLLLAGGGFRLGQHVVFPDEKGRRVPAANLLLSMLQNFGLEVERFGTSTGTLTGLERAPE